MSEASSKGGLRSSPLEQAHIALGARLVGFGGWLMPLSYPSGTIAEHMACRRDSAVFDVSHLGTLEVSGPGAFERLQRELTNDLRKISPGGTQYSHLLDPADGSVLDDVIVWWLEEELFHVMPNASNTARVIEALAGRGASVADVTAERVVLALQGPNARSRLSGIAQDAAATPRSHVRRFAFEGVDCLVAGTGYTGEDGVECALPIEKAEPFFHAVLEAGVSPAGLGARDTLRLEAGLPLHGHELGPGITPLQAGLSFVVSWSKGDFRGRFALEAEMRAGVPRRLVGLVTEGRQPPREQAEVFLSGKRVGHVTSGNFSPVLGRGIALALVSSLRPDGSAWQEGTDVEVRQRGRSLRARVVDPPFVRPGHARKEELA